MWWWRGDCGDCGGCGGGGCGGVIVVVVVVVVVVERVGWKEVLRRWMRGDVEKVGVLRMISKRSHCICIIG